MWSALSASLFCCVRGLVAATIALAGTPLVAHDLWLEPTNFSPKLDQIVGVRLRVGQNLAGDPVSLSPWMVKQFIVEDSLDRRPVVNLRGAEPAGLLRVTTPGLLVIGYYGHPSTLELPAETFNAYLKEEGLDSIIALRALRNEADAKSRELYSRCAKSLVLSGSPSEAEGDRTLGFPPELVAERNPYSIVASQDLPVRLTYEDQPLGGALVIAMNSLNPSEKQAARTDNDGRVRFRLHAGGMWLVKAVHMVPAPPGADAEWMSFWASLTFESGAANAGQNYSVASSIGH